MGRILIAESSGDVQTLLEHAVRRLGHEPVPYERASRHDPPAADVLLLEPELAGGLELAAAMRRRCPELPIVVCSIRPPAPEVRALAPVAELVKPPRRGELEDALVAALGLAGVEDDRAAQ